MSEAPRRSREAVSELERNNKGGTGLPGYSGRGIQLVSCMSGRLGQKGIRDTRIVEWLDDETNGTRVPFELLLGSARVRTQMREGGWERGIKGSYRRVKEGRNKIFD